MHLVADIIMRMHGIKFEWVDWKTGSMLCLAHNHIFPYISFDLEVAPALDTH